MGHFADLTAPRSGFRYTPESRLKSDITPCPKSARSRHHLLFYYFVGACKKRRRNVEIERLGGLSIDRQLEFGRLLDG
jgi:hypothetical protein